MLTLLLVISLQAPGDWPVYGHDVGGARYSPLSQITRANVSRLQVAWTYHTGMPALENMGHRPPAREVTPIVVDGVMYGSTPTGIVDLPHRDAGAREHGPPPPRARGDADRGRRRDVCEHADRHRGGARSGDRGE